MSLEALLANLRPYQAQLHELRGFRGAVTSAANLRRLIEGSDLATGKIKIKVQDAYSMRSTPQVIGALRDAVAYARTQVEIELNGVADNPIFVADEDLVLTGANFQGTPVSLPLDVVGAGVTMVCVLSERRLNRLLNPALSVGLPAFLTKGAGHVLGPHAVAVHGRHAHRGAAHPLDALVHPVHPGGRRPGRLREHGHERASSRPRRSSKNACGVLGIELIAGAQALDFRGFQAGRGTRAAHRAVRAVVEHLEEDRPLFPDHNAMAAAVERGDVLEAVEREIGAARRLLVGSVSSW